jgi:hypothetical protein
MPGKRVAFDPEDWVGLDQLARERHVTFQQLAAEAFADVLKKHDKANEKALTASTAKSRRSKRKPSQR